MNTRKEHRTITIFVRKQSTYNKVTRFIRYLIHLENVLRLIAQWEERNYDYCIITSNRYQLPKLMTGSFEFDKTDEYIEHLVQHAKSVKTVIGGVYAESIAHKIAREVKSVIGLRTNKKNTSMPRPKSFEKRHLYTFSVGWFNYSVKSCANSNKLIIRLGSKRAQFSEHFSIRIPKSMIPKHLTQSGQIPICPELKITWIQDVGIIVHLTYEIEIEQYELASNNFLSIDFGYKNIATLVSNNLNNAIVISGRPLNSFLYWVTKKVAKLQSQNKQVRQLYMYSKRVTRHFTSRLANEIVDMCRKNDIGTIVIGDFMSIFQTKSKGKFNLPQIYEHFGRLGNTSHRRHDQSLPDSG